MSGPLTARQLDQVREIVREEIDAYHELVPHVNRARQAWADRLRRSWRDEFGPRPQGWPDPDLLSPALAHLDTLSVEHEAELAEAQQALRAIIALMAPVGSLMGSEGLDRLLIERAGNG